MNKIKIKSDIRKYIIESSVAQSNQLEDDTHIFDSGILDSMGLLFLIEYLNENYDIQVNDEELVPENFETVDRIVNFLEKKLN